MPEREPSRSAPYQPHSVAGTDPMEPFAVTIPSLRAPDPSVALPGTGPSSVTDGLVWGAVALTSAGVLGLFWLPLNAMMGIGPLVSAFVVALLLIDRRTIREARCADTPGWVWALLPPAYLIRRSRALGRQPLPAYALVALGIGTRVGIAVFGLGGGQLAAMPGFETRLAEVYGALWEQPATADCPRRVTMERDVEFMCVVVSADGDSRVELTFRVVDDAGGAEMIHSSFSGRTSSREPTYNVAP